MEIFDFEICGPEIFDSKIDFKQGGRTLTLFLVKNKNITQTMLNCSMYVCDVHFLLIWLLLPKNYTINNLIKVWHWIDQIILRADLEIFNFESAACPKILWQGLKKSAPLSNSNLLLVIGVTDKNKLTVFDRDDLYPNVFTGANEY